MPPSFEQLFLSKIATAAARCAADTGLWTSVVMAQWCNETFYGTSRAWVLGNNPAGISPDGVIASYPSEAAGFSAWINTMNTHYYDGVRAAKAQGDLEQAYALGRSPWAGGKYIATGSTVPGSSLVEIIDSLGLSTYNGAEDALAAPVPTIPMEDDDMNGPFVAEIAGEEGQFIIWPTGVRTFIADGNDVPMLLTQFGQDKSMQLSGGTIAQIPPSAQPIAKAPEPAPAPA